MYAKLGAKVVVNDMSKDAAATVVDEITRGQSPSMCLVNKVLCLRHTYYPNVQRVERLLLQSRASQMGQPLSRTLSILSELFM